MATSKMKKYKSTEEFIVSFPKEVQTKLTSIRTLIKEEMPDSEEKIGYGIPTYKLSGKNIVHFAAFKNHISLFPGPKAVKHFKKNLEQYKTSKGTIQFPLERPLPLGLIRRVVKFAKRTNLK